MGNGTRVQVVSLGIIRLHLNIEKKFIVLQNVAFTPFIRRNLILYLFWIDFDIIFFRTGKVNLYRDSLLIGNGTLYENLY